MSDNQDLLNLIIAMRDKANSNKNNRAKLFTIRMYDLDRVQFAYSSGFKDACEMIQKAIVENPSYFEMLKHFRESFAYRFKSNEELFHDPDYDNKDVHE